jgi:hypothetical protein
MRTGQFVVVALLILGISAQALTTEPVANKRRVVFGDLSDPAPLTKDHGSQDSIGQATSRYGDYSTNLRRVTYETAIERILPSSPLMSFSALANHVISVSKLALGFDAILSDQTLAELAWIFRLRHMPAPEVVAAQSTRWDVERLVKYVLTNEKVRTCHHFRECDIDQLVASVQESVETLAGFVFRIIDGDSTEYSPLGLHQIESRQHYFAAVHSEEKLFVSFVCSSLKGEFIKGHGQESKFHERESAHTFLRQWLLNQWVNLWTCTNPSTK